ncbi:Ti-type conjugative transfer relaxase TraA [Roseobacter sinensis]|uniref:Ti-type conjugative transfer relaxase TraA n=1 Tax=Roseobacter sinensis TaxID=2931391 RepID=A0ABT3BGQ2_9RHOB|nr:Ti-type conjugative transfer relaxase TraA [Roseobacter sp. WL0113]MCV3272720.1 Ti-type conjugative transfer relaxase TraA [Roseobacter sp. WL0113]
MAIYHLHMKVIGRSSGASAVAAAAYRSASRLRDDRIERSHDFTAKRGVVHSEVLLPEGAPDALSDRERLWNAVEACEVRRDAQLARELEFALPREMSEAQAIDLARDFVQSEFVDRGMIADLNVHWDRTDDGLAKPHAHVMLTMRSVDEDGFGPKVRDWNRTDLLQRWRERWAEFANERLAELDIDARIDHRSLEAQGIALEPQDKIGAPAQRIMGEGREADRAEMHRSIARENGTRIIADPSLALDAITRQQATFTRRDMAAFAHRHSDGPGQFDAVLGAMRRAPDLVVLGQDVRGEERFTSRDMLEAEQRLHRAALAMAERARHSVDVRDRDAALARAEARGLILSAEQAEALTHITDWRDLGIVIGHAGTGKSAMLGVAREAWEAAGYRVRGAALSGIAAENLEGGSGIGSRTLASLEQGWAQGRDALSPRDILVIDEAGMVGTRQLERLLSHASEAGAKVVLVGDPQQLQSIEAGAAFRSLHDRHGGARIGEVRRQREDWQREATRDLATGQTEAALAAYEAHGHVHAADTRAAAREALIEGWDRNRRADPEASRIILTHTNDEVRALNLAARERMREAGDLGPEVRLTVERGERSFAPGDRVMFLQNDRGLGVKNGTLGTIAELDRQAMTVRTEDGRAVRFDLKDYDRIDHGYAATIHKAQGMTVDRAHVLATPGLDAHASYVALTRHRDGVELHYGRDDFASPERLARTLGRERAKDMALDHAGTDPAEGFAARRGIDVGHHAPEPPDIDPQPDDLAEAREAALRPARTRALIRHAEAVHDVFETLAQGDKASPEQVRSLNRARDAFEALRPDGWRDAEAAYLKDPTLARDAAKGQLDRAIRALQLDTELRTDPRARANRFVERWQQLDRRSGAQYSAGDYTGYHASRKAMTDMARSLERDPQLESLLANRKRDLGISSDMGRRLGEALAFSHGLELGRSRGLGL